MRKTLLVGAAAGIAAIGFGVSASAAVDITTAQTLHLVSKTVESRFVEIGHSGPPKLGDEFISHSTLTDGQGNPVGESAVVCTIVSTQGHGMDNCVGTLSLPGGLITIQTLSTGRTFDGAVTGGTGNYQNARGEAEINTVTNHITVSLIP